MSDENRPETGTRGPLTFDEQCALEDYKSKLRQEETRSSVTYSSLMTDKREFAMMETRLRVFICSVVLTLMVTLMIPFSGKVLSPNLCFYHRCGIAAAFLLSVSCLFRALWKELKTAHATVKSDYLTIEENPFKEEPARTDAERKKSMERAESVREGYNSDKEADHAFILACWTFVVFLLTSLWALVV